MPNKFCWYELLTQDPKGAQAFYPAITGWGTQKMEGMDYTMWTHGGTPFAGLMQLPEAAAKMGAPTHWLGYVEVEDVDAKLAEAGRRDARVLVPPTDIPNIGRFAVFADPYGAALALYRSANPQPPAPTPATPPDGSVSWHELLAGDLEGAWRFYASLFGWEKAEDMDMGPGGVYRLFTTDGGKPIGGMFKKPAEVPVSAWLYYIHVADLDAAIETAKSRGGKLLMGPMEVPGGDRIAQLLDPQGGAFALHAAARK